ncbi:hypothetical protein [Lentzea albida]|uniref:Uncharacterized protein n=1 Tax=Lentzea albida TaxID=65499 RepID=A0A1H9GQ97_9PSEU|nr:hypothetical protein [Lentzea albida]SEQ52210.1 hypothetical protein SAMN04488000_103223 [Lentzea albida]
MPEKYGPSARAALLRLMLENRAIPNPELVAEFKIRLEPKERERLNSDGLLETSKVARRLVHEITAKGRDWCRSDLRGGGSPTRSGPLARVHADILQLVLRFLDERGLLAEAFSARDLESLIRSVYEELAEEPQDWIRLARIRPRLNGADRGEVDETLVKMMKTGTVHLAPESNTKVLTAEDHASALRVGSEDLHLVAMEES